MKNPIISIVLGSYNRVSFLPLTINSIRAELRDIPHEIIVVDGGSDDGALEYLLQQKDIITIVQHNRGIWNDKPIERRSWGYFMNLGFKIAQGKYVCMLSDDCLIVPGAIRNGIVYFDDQLAQGRRVGALAFYWRNWSKEDLYNVAFTLGSKMYVNHGMYLNKVLQEVGYCDEENFFFYCGDGDLCLKMWQAGYECIEAPDSYIEHYPHANIDVRKSNCVQSKQDLKNYLRKWEGVFYDPRVYDLGGGREKPFIDNHKTGEQFLALHEQIVLENPEVGKPETRFAYFAKRLGWKWDAIVRKINCWFKPS